MSRRTTAAGSSSCSASRARSTRSPTSPVSSSSWETTSASSSRRSSSASRSEWVSTSMLVRMLASGVRSSCEASATSWRCASSELSSAFSIRLKLLASAAISSFPVDSIRRLRSRVVATCSAARRSRSTGATAARDTNRPRPPARAMPPRLTSSRITASCCRVSSTSSSGRATWIARPGSIWAV